MTRLSQFDPDYAKTAKYDRVQARTLDLNPLGGIVAFLQVYLIPVMIW